MLIKHHFAHFGQSTLRKKAEVHCTKKPNTLMKQRTQAESTFRYSGQQSCHFGWVIDFFVCKTTQRQPESPPNPFRLP